MSSTYESRKTWTSWRKGNFDFFQRNLKGLSGRLLDLGAGPEQFRDITWQFDKTAADFEKFSTTDVVVDLTKTLPFNDASFDVVFASNFFEHIAYPLPVFKECYRLIKQGGILIGTTPFMAQIHQAPHDYNRYTYFMLEKLLKDSGFTFKIIPMGSPIKVYLNMQDQVFSKLRKQKNKTLLSVIKLLHRLVLIGSYSIMSGEPVKEFCQGYGFIGKKT
jgi:SAM-dependent methyltransferase